MKHPSLIQLFEAPPGFNGTVGSLCGYTADALFINEALERFTGASASSRASAGRVGLVMMLDPGQPQISWGDVPGALHMPVKRLEALPFSLMHAKVAVLAFRRTDAAQGWRLRLIVSTGNWTIQTVEDSLDLAWSIDVDSEEIASPTQGLRQRAADMHAGANLLRWLRPWFDDRLLLAPLRGEPGPAQLAQAEWEKSIDACATLGKDQRPRFFDSRSGSLLDQLPDLIRAHAGEVRRSQLVMGSGFYEGNCDPGSVPGVPKAIVDRLQKAGLLTQTAQISLVVNEQGCQAVAAAMKAIEDSGWLVHPPSRAEHLYGIGNRRTLHAKFLVGWNPKRSEASRCISTWVYLGSGNLTCPGFMQRAQRGLGNLEAGVVFPAGELLLEVDRKVADLPVLSHLLPYDPGTQLTTQQPPLAGAEMPERPDPWIAPPLAYVQWQPDVEGGRLCAQEDMPFGLELLDTQGRPCPGPAGNWTWLGEPPPQVCIRWGDGQEHAWIPVQDDYGRVAPRPQPSMKLQEALGHLEGFPALMASDVDDGDTDNDPEARSSKKDLGPGASLEARYAMRQMMQLVETVARKQVLLPEEDWQAWCLRLEQVLVLAQESSEVHAFRSLQTQPLNHLLAPGFCPVYAREPGAKAGQRLLIALQRIAQAWQLPLFVKREI